MYRATLRTAPSALRAIRPTTVASGSRRLASTAAAAKKKGTWTGTGLRWGLAIAAVYFYNTSPIFADELPPVPAPPHFSDADLPTIDAMIEEKRRQAAAAAAAAAPPPPPPSSQQQPANAVSEKEDVKTEQTKPTETEAATTAAAENEPEPGSPEALEQSATEQGAFDPETGEINWDCPCLGGMAHGPCGEEFKAAFSCFVYSKEEPKGMDCIEKFQHMQDCFRKYPEIYGSELADDEDEEGAPAQEGAAAAAKTSETQTSASAAPPAAGTGESAAQPAETTESGAPKKDVDAIGPNKGKE
ncbi:uncharacterized protein THITE_2116216 [Thermothielavioides terrestris NRRL 8126]|uniref:Mitochondrial intermembrane space import and assembly protein 40 n=1 Tax=Thermothielavioides terrestris (strain ATCC 38088 / NRRL 8126) TaxID=578455 RepID=G2R0R8_THETT|nr:uncharacterized protein THITE_2116216 [Thermothielavioides terrestris NRRL 8126]AEO67329.1 hypothetical protein THITE_2116216 [Thermothielavioides terrestris NRRL 8126]